MPNLEDLPHPAPPHFHQHLKIRLRHRLAFRRAADRGTIAAGHRSAPQEVFRGLLPQLEGFKGLRDLEALRGGGALVLVPV